MSVFVVSLSLRYFVLHITQALVFSPDTLAEIPEGANANALDPPARSRAKTKFCGEPRNKI